MLRISYITKVETQNALRNAGPQWQKKPRERLSQKKMDNRLRDQIGLITDGRMEAMRHGSKAATRGGASSSSGLTPTPAGSKVLVVLGPHEKVPVRVDPDFSIGQLIDKIHDIRAAPFGIQWCIGRIDRSNWAVSICGRIYDADKENKDFSLRRAVKECSELGCVVAEILYRL